MDPTDLTCGKCGKSWKLIKAGAGPVTCPHCKAPLDTRPATPTIPVCEQTMPNATSGRDRVGTHFFG